MFKFIVALIYIMVMLMIGFISSKKIKSSQDFAVAGKAIPFWRNVHSMSSASIGAGATMGVAGIVFGVGISGLVLGIGAALGVALSGWLFAKKIRESEATTIPELIRLKLGPKVAAGMSILIIFQLFSAVAAQIRSLGIVSQMFMDVSLPVACIIMSIVMVIYAALGGMVSATKTDSINMSLMALAVMVILPILVLSKVGGFTGMVASLEPRYFDPVGMGVLPMLALVFWIVPVGMTGSENFLRISGAINAKEAKAALITSALMVTLPYMLACGVIGLAGAALVPNITNPDAIIPTLIDTLANPYLGSILLAALLAAVMGTAASLVIVTSVTFTENVIKRINPNIKGKKEIFVTRVGIAVITALGIVVAIYAKSIIGIMQDISAPAVAVTLPVFVGMFFWKKTTTQGAMAAMIVGVITTVGWWIYGFISFGGHSPFAVHHIIVGIICTSISMIGVSLATYDGTNGTIIKPVEEGVV